MNKEAFDRAVAHAVAHTGVTLSSVETRFIHAVRDETRFDETVERNIKALAAAVVMVSQRKRVVKVYGNTLRECVAYLASVDHWLKQFADSPEFSFSFEKKSPDEIIQIRNAQGKLLHVSAYVVPPNPVDRITEENEENNE